MKRILAAAAIAALSAGVAFADNLAGYYGNTVVITSPDGKVTKSKVAADKTYTTTTPDGKTTKGTWAWQDDKVACFTQTDPAPAAGMKPLCLPIDAHKVGDKWDVKGKDGKVVASYELTGG